LTDDRLTDLEQRLGHSFVRRELLELALVHAGAARRGDRGNERLEFLGDRVLGLVVAEMLFRQFPKEREGDLARRHARLVERRTLAQVATQIGLGRFLVLSRGDDDAGNRNNAGILADAMEAVIAAIYLDGGFDVVRGFIERFLAPLMAENVAPPRDAKTSLQEWALGRGLPLPIYQVISQSGPSHDPVFEITVEVSGFPPQSAQGRSKREAERQAASQLLRVIEETPRHGR